MTHKSREPNGQTTIHTTPRSGEVWAGAVERNRRGHAPDRHIVREPDGEYRAGHRTDLPQAEGVTHGRTNFSGDTFSSTMTPNRWSTMFRWYEQWSGTIMSPKPQPDARRPSPEEFDQASRFIDTYCYMVRVKGKVCGMFNDRRRAANFAANSGNTAEFLHVAPTYKYLDYAAQVLPRSDRARGPSAVLAGQGTKVVRHKVCTGFSEQRLDPYGRDGASNDRTKKERSDATYESRRWRKDKSAPPAATESHKRKRYPASVAQLAPSGSTDPKHPWAGVDKPVARRLCRAS